MNGQTSRGLHPNAQRLLWAIVYNQRQSFDDLRPYGQLERAGLIKKIGPGYTGGGQWEPTPSGVAELQKYARFLARDGLMCPPNA
ncbi:hypothetical protein KDW40_19170 [Burkholderia cenocepacia]|uniref:hypothetical protein n=1 Tax=Burkholderia cenocepacia TaxID=95486 RepID=UPI001B92C10C|nr:hypothetical protein [Burkholderia cenocepacia]MBR8043492.1 hypothetical protein [Burkholderia cenocepacia]MBR8327853.1 hypothetical protein [Burkholderia cenocepacia]